MRGGDRTGICEYRGEAQGEDGAGSLHAKAGRSVSLCPDRDGEGAAGNGASGAGGMWRGVWEVWCADAHHVVLLSCI